MNFCSNSTISFPRSFRNNETNEKFALGFTSAEESSMRLKQVERDFRQLTPKTEKVEKLELNDLFVLACTETKKEVKMVYDARFRSEN